jgi:hypothetical protein
MFRGKDKNDGKMVYGGISFYRDGAVFITTMGKDKISYISRHIEVEPQSLAMKTGKQDKHGVEIYGSFEYEPGKMSKGGDRVRKLETKTPKDIYSESKAVFNRSSFKLQRKGYESFLEWPAEVCLEIIKGKEQE